MGQHLERFTFPNDFSSYPEEWGIYTFILYTLKFWWKEWRLAYSQILPIHYADAIN